MIEQLLNCPECHAGLEINGVEGNYICAACGFRYSVHDGMVDFAPDNRFYWGEVSRERMEQVNEQAERSGWFPAFLEVIDGANQRDMVRYLLDPVRIAGIFHYYNPHRKGVCVDLGSGWGPISFGLSQYYDTVYSMDGVYERLRFQAIRAQQDGIENIRILKGSLLKLPLPDNTADTVIVNGLLEWIGLSDEVTPPRELQLAFLREVRRILKPDGRMLIGIENRTGAQFLMGSRDHSGLRYTSLMPRWMADRVVRRARRLDDASFFDGANQNYRTLTYTAWGYQTLLREAGFARPDVYWTWPSYNEPRVSGTLDGNSVEYYLNLKANAVRGLARRAIVGAVRRLPKALGLLIRIFAPHFLILAGKERAEASLEDTALDSHPRRGLLRITPHTERNLDTDYVVLNGRGARKLASVSERQDGDGREFFLQKEEGEWGRPMNLREAADIRAAAEWLANFQRENSQGTASASEREAEIWRLAENTRWFTRELAGQVEDYAQAYIEMVRKHLGQKVMEHGEFVPRNIFINRQGKAQATGWEHSQPDGNPLMDAGALMLALLLERPGGAAVFERAYRPESGLAPQMAPVYYILRMIERDFDPLAGEAHNYLGRTVWIPRLKGALAYAGVPARAKIPA